MNNIKLIATDLDRTLLRTGGTISPYTAGVLSRCRRQGVMIAFATARYFLTMEKWLIPQIGFTPDIVISSNGAYAYGDSNVWYSAFIPPDLANQVIDEIRSRGGKTAVGTVRQRLSERQIEETHKSFTLPWDFKQPLTEDVHFIDHLGGAGFALDITKLFPQIRLQGYIDPLTTILNKDARKGLALKEVMAKLNITSEEAVGFGDDINDLDFLEVCGVKVAVANAVAEVKAIASHICASNDCDGVAHWLEENVL